jgi:hypothetical protein
MCWLTKYSGTPTTATKRATALTYQTPNMIELKMAVKILIE